MNGTVIGNRTVRNPLFVGGGGFTVWRDIDQGISYIVATVPGTTLIIQSGLFHRISEDIDILGNKVCPLLALYRIRIYLFFKLSLLPGVFELMIF